MKNGHTLTRWILLLSLCGGSSAYAAFTHKLESPDKRLSVSVRQSEAGVLSYSFSAEGKPLIQESALGFSSEKSGKIPSADWTASDVSSRRENAVWTPVWGKRSSVSDQFNELTINLSGKSSELPRLRLVFRIYNDGVAFRYMVPSTETKTLSQVEEVTEYDFAGDYTAWFYNGERHNIGPKKLSDCAGKFLPVMTVQVDENNFMALHEADLSVGAPLSLQSGKGEDSFSVSPQKRNLSPGDATAWRVVMYGKTPGDMVDSHLIELLNPEPAGDFSWVKPGVAVWDWRIDGAQIDGFTYTMSYPSWIRMVDFAAEQGLKHLVLDANWYGPEHEANSNPVENEKAQDVQRLLKYAKEKGVGVWLYLNDVGGRKYDIAKTLQQYGEWGASGVKYGFMSGSQEEKNAWTRRITELCAKNYLLVNFHDGPVHPYGQMRTWPNAVAREYCHAQLDAHRVFEPKTFVTSVFVNMLAGPIDMNNGMFDLRQGKTTRVDENQPVPSTLVSEAARTLIVFSGATILPDIPEFYKKYPDLLRFIAAQKMPWKESKTLKGQIGEYIVMMRETEDAYLVGAATNESTRDIDIPLSFLPEGECEMLLVQDGKDAHYLTNREVLSSETRKVTRKDTVPVHLAPGGGACLLIKKSGR